MAGLEKLGVKKLPAEGAGSEELLIINFALGVGLGVLQYFYYGIVNGEEYFMSVFNVA